MRLPGLPRSAALSVHSSKGGDGISGGNGGRSRAKGRGHGLVHSCPGTLGPERAGRDGLRAGPRERDGSKPAAAPVWGKEEERDLFWSLVLICKRAEIVLILKTAEGNNRSKWANSQEASVVSYN